jgi:hypothetical protein
MNYLIPCPVVVAVAWLVTATALQLPTLEGQTGWVSSAASERGTISPRDVASAATNAEGKRAVPVLQPENKEEVQIPKGWQKLTSKEGGFQVCLLGPAAELNPNNNKERSWFSADDKPVIWFSAADLAKGQSTSVGCYDLNVPEDMRLNKEWQELILAQIAPGLAKGPKAKTADLGPVGGAVGGAVRLTKASKAKAADLRKVTVGEYPGLEETDADESSVMRIRFLMVGKRMFILTAEGRTNNDAEQLAAAMFASFAVLPEFARNAKVKAPTWERFPIPDVGVSVLMPGKPSAEEGKGPEELGKGRMKTHIGYHPEQAMILSVVCIRPFRK